MYSAMSLGRVLLEVTLSFYQVAQRKRWRMRKASAILLGEGIFDAHTEVLLTGIQVFGPDARARGSLGGCDDHGVVKMKAISTADSDGAADGFLIRWDRLDGG